MIQCDVFEIEAEITSERDIVWHVFTDLPCGTRMIYSFDRLYTDHDGQECEWSLQGSSATLDRTDRGDLNGVSGRFSVDDGDAEALRDFGESLGDYSAGIKTPMSEDIHLSFTVGLRQPLKAFGKRNENLDGSMVEDQGHMKVVRAELLVTVPIKAEFKPME